jgi:hypothetical protein
VVAAGDEEAVSKQDSRSVDDIDRRASVACSSVKKTEGVRKEYEEKANRRA